MPDIADNINQIRQCLVRTAQIAGRNPTEITLLAVSKTWGVECLRSAWEAGQRDFGENYLQEAQAKIAALADLEGLVWHFIGPIQSNKTRAISENFSWVHSVDRLQIAERLNKQRPAQLPPLNICIQVNIDCEPTKSGILPEDVAALAASVAKLPQLRLRGLMAIPEPSSDLQKQRQPFFRLRQLLDTLRGLSPQLAKLDTLSMGMSDDMEAAILEGATLVRVGSAIFGRRQNLRKRPVEAQASNNST